MPRPPHTSAATQGMRSDLFSSLAHRIAGLKGTVYPLHIGDTWLDPAEGARMEDFRVAEHPGLHRYSRPHGHPRLVAAIAQRRDVDPGRILVTAGATGGLGALAGAVLEPGDEVLVLAPFWPLIRGIVQTARGVPVEVPFYDRPGSVEDLLAPHLTERTVALYVNTPNNPTGRVLDADTVAALAHFARQRDLWLWSDDVYEDFAFTRPHVPVAPHAPERSFTACSFSKAYGMAGNRVGYVVGPEGEVMQALRKISTHSFYSAPTAAQLAAAHVLEHGAPWLERASQLYRQSGEAAAARLGLDPPQGGTFLFLDVSAHLDERGLLGFLERCMDRKLLIAPGSSCGTDYPGHVRLCFTSAPPEAVRAGVEVLAELLGIPSSS